MTKKHNDMLKHDPVAEAIVHFLAKVKANAKVLVPVVILVCLLAVVVVYTVNKKMNKPFEAAAALVQVQDLTELEKISTDYAGTFAAPISILKLASREYSLTNYAAAVVYYDRVLTENPDFFLVPSVLLAKAKCKIALGQLQEAADIISNELLYEGQNYAGLSAQLTLVKILTLQKRYGDAWAEMKAWDQKASTLGMGSMADGLREELLRLSGASTAVVAQVENQELAANTTVEE